MILGALLLAATLFTAYTAQSAIADHEPAMKAGAAGDDLQATAADEKPIALLSETMRVSSPEDLIIQVTSECSILTSLLTGDGANASTSGDEASDSAFAFGQVKMFVTVDGTRVPVAVNDTATSPGDDSTDKDDLGEVVFCNRAYQRTVTDSEDDEDGLDTQDDFIRTRTANAFNWLAFDTGVNYDSPANGNNVIHVILWGEFDKEPEACATDDADDARTPLGRTCAEALVGSRTMIIEPIRVSNHEVIEPHEPTPAPTTTTPAGGKPKP